MRKQVLILNRKNGPFKVPFKLGTPIEEQRKIHAIIPIGRKITIPSELYEYLDLERLEFADKKRQIKLVIVDVPEQKIYSVPKPKKKKKGPGRPKKSEMDEEKEDKQIDEKELVVKEDMKEDK